VSDTPVPAPALSINRLSVTLPNGHRLLHEVNLDVRAGEFVLLVGPSGSGKSTLLGLIAGFDEHDQSPLNVRGRIEVSRTGAAARDGQTVGMVFQNLALFDELSAIDNVRFAIDHRREKPDDPRRLAADYLKRLNVPTRSQLTQLSGGERQRVAVARTLAMDPPILLFDEPTTGLDPYRARSVADLIVKTHQKSGKTVIVVTHDFAPFLEASPRLILLDSEAARLREVGESELVEYFDEHDVDTEAIDKAALAPPAAPRMRWVSWFESSGAALLTLLASLATPFLSWGQPRWKLRYLWHYLRLVLVGTTALYVAVAGAMLGFVTVFFGFSQLPYTEVMVPLLTEEFLAATGYSTFRVLVPLLTSVLIAGKCGAALGADAGARRLTHQYEAMRSFGAEPPHYLHGNMVIALCIGCPLLAIIAYITNCYASLVAFLFVSEQATIAVFRRNFFATVWPLGGAFPVGAGWVILKMATCGVLIAALSYSIGSRRKASSVDVSRDVGLTIFWGSLGVLAVHTGYAFWEF